MPKRIFITATNTDVGKTYTTKLLLKQYSSLGYNVGVIKPFETGVIGLNALDGNELLGLLKELNPKCKDFILDDIIPFRYELPSAPYVASGKVDIDFKKLDLAISKMEKVCDVLLIEGAGGLYVPLDKDYMIIDLIKYFNATTLFISHCALGCINDTLLGVKALEGYGIKHLVAFNCLNNSDFSVKSEPYFKDIMKQVLKVDENIDTISELLYNL